MNVEVYELNGSSITRRMGILNVKDEFTSVSVINYWGTLIAGTVIVGGVVSRNVINAINGKAVMVLDSWTNNGNSITKNFSRSIETYLINGAPYVIVSPRSNNAGPKVKNTRPVLNQIAPEWDAEVGALFTLPLSVVDQEQDEFEMTSSLKGASFSEVYDLNQLCTVDFQWMPTEAQAHKVYSVKFRARELEGKNYYRIR